VNQVQDGTGIRGRREPGKQPATSYNLKMMVSLMESG